MTARPERQFYFRLAGHLNSPSVRHLLAHMGSRELTEWMAYERVAGPLGPGRGDYLAALVATTVANANRPKGKRAARLKDFLIRWDKGRRATPEELWTKAMTAFRPEEHDT